MRILKSIVYGLLLTLAILAMIVGISFGLDWLSTVTTPKERTLGGFVLFILVCCIGFSYYQLEEYGDKE